MQQRVAWPAGCWAGLLSLCLHTDGHICFWLCHAVHTLGHTEITQLLAGVFSMTRGPTLSPVSCVGVMSGVMVSVVGDW